MASVSPISSSVDSFLDRSPIKNPAISSGVQASCNIKHIACAASVLVRTRFSDNFFSNSRIVAVDFSGPNEAMAKVELSIPGIDFVDFLSLMKVDGRWRIIAKTYHAMPQG